MFCVLVSGSLGTVAWTRKNFLLFPLMGVHIKQVKFTDNTRTFPMVCMGVCGPTIPWRGVSKVVLPPPLDFPFSPCDWQSTGGTYILPTHMATVFFSSHKFYWQSLFFRCPVKTDDPIPCGNGSFAPEGSTYCHGCPIGSQCPSAKLAYHQLCANGSYSLVVNATSCLECPPGFKCPNPNVEPVECENGTYSKAGATHCVICPGGHR